MRSRAFLGVAGPLAGLLVFSGCQPASPTGARELLRHVRVLASEIGPRPPGSPTDRRAQAYILGEFEKAGLEARLERVGTVRISDSTDLVLDSANVIGILPGTETGAILLGAHHDTRNAFGPGASDDASGVAVLLEAARILSRQPRRNTLIFASFAGEETFGLPGSRQFLRDWFGPPIRMALTFDFVGSGKIFVSPFPVPPPLWANRLLAGAAREGHALDVWFDPWLVTVPRLMSLPFGADHSTFLESGIPAFNLSCQFPAWIYHTSQDLADRVEPRTLAAARDVAVRVASTVDSGGLPKGDDSGYLPLSLLGRPVFLTSDVLRLATPLVALLALATLWKWKQELRKGMAWAEAVRSVIVALPLAILAGSGPFLARAAQGGITGWHDPGYAYPGVSLASALTAGALTLWASMLLAHFIRPSLSPGAYLAPAILMEGILAFSLAGLEKREIAFPFLAGTTALLLAAWTASAVRKLGWALIGLAALIPFVSSTTYRMFLELSGARLPSFSMEVGAFVLLFPWYLFLQHLTCLPEALHGRVIRHLFRARIGAILALVFLVALTASVLSPAYDADHRILVEIREEIEVGGKTAQVTLNSRETLRGVRLLGAGDRRLPDSGDVHFQVPVSEDQVPALDISTAEGSEGELICRVRSLFARTPRWISLAFRAPGRLAVYREGRWDEPREEYRRLIFPVSGRLEEEIRIRATGGGPVSLEPVAAFEEDILDLQPAGEHRVFQVSAHVRWGRRKL